MVLASSNAGFYSYQKDTLLLLSSQDNSAVSAIQPTTFDYNSFTPALAGTLELLSKLKRKGYYYCRRQIELDGLTFEECSFENCHFIVNKGTFNLINCRIYGADTKFVYGEQALKVARLYEFMNSSVHNAVVFPNLFPQVDNEGRITI